MVGRHVVELLHGGDVSQVALDYRAKVVGLYRSLGFEADELAVLSALTVGDNI